MIAAQQKEDHAETCGAGECENDQDVIVVRTLNQESATMAGSMLGGSPLQQRTITLKGSPVNVTPVYQTGNK